MAETKPKQQVKKKIPERRCVGCQGTFPKKELLRVVRSPEGIISIDFTGKKSGRGAYICQNETCFKKARKSNRIASMLDCAIPEEIYDEMQKRIAEEA